VDPVLVTATFGYGRDAGVLLEGRRVREAVALLSKCGEEARGEDAAGAGEICEEGEVGQLVSSGDLTRSIVEATS
jgi:hypothetical protein